MVAIVSDDFGDMQLQWQIRVQQDAKVTDNIGQLYCFHADSKTEIFPGKFGEIVS